MPALTKLSEIDEVLIRYGDTLSLEALSFKLEGKLTPLQCRHRLDQLLTAPDHLTQLQQDQLITHKMRQIVVELEELPRTTRNGEVLLAGLERIGNRLDKRAEATEKDLKSLYAFQGTVFLDAVVAALGVLVKDEDSATKARLEAKLETAIQVAEIEMAQH